MAQGKPKGPNLREKGGHESDPVAQIGARKGMPRHDSQRAARGFLDPFRTITSPELKALSAGLLESYKANAAKGRQRAWRQDDLAAIKAIVDTILANIVHSGLIHELQTPLAAPLAKSRKAASRYEREGLRKLPDVVHELCAAGCIGLDKSRVDGIASSIWASPKLAAAIGAIKPTFGDLKRLPFEIIRLTTPVKQYAKATNEDGEVWAKPSARSDRVDYTDTSQTIRARRKLRALNTWLAQARLDFLKPGNKVDTTAAVLCRIFTIPKGVPVEDYGFDLHGRLYWGWWQGIGAEDRQFITINGEHVADMDFSSMFPRLACLQAGFEFPPRADPYAVPGVPRENAKAALNAMLNRKTPCRDHEVPKDPETGRPVLPTGWAMGRFREALREAHGPRLLEVLEHGPRGLALMFAESELMMVLMEELKRRGIIALPMHDGVMVQERKAAETAKAMREVSCKVLGMALPVKRKAVVGLDRIDPSSPSPGLNT